MKFGLIGCPVQQSLSPVLFNGLFTKLGLDYSYSAYEVKEDELDSFLSWFRRSELKGVNVTIPHKEKVCGMVDELSEEARKIGAVNAIIKFGGKLIGDNTDAYGFRESLKELNGQWKKALIFGGGGAARAVLCSLSLFKPERITLVEKSKAKREKLKNDFQEIDSLEIIDWDLVQILGKMKKADLVVNATPLGMEGISEDFPVEAQFDLSGKLFLDLIYKPEITPFMKIGIEGRARVKNGLSMLLSQAMKSLELWTGIRTEFRDWLEIYENIKREKDSSLISHKGEER